MLKMLQTLISNKVGVAMNREYDELIEQAMLATAFSLGNTIVELGQENEKRFNDLEEAINRQTNEQLIEDCLFVDHTQSGFSDY